MDFICMEKMRAAYRAYSFSICHNSAVVCVLLFLLQAITAVWQSLDEGKRHSQSHAGAFMTSSGRK